MPLHVSATLVVILRVVHYRGYITEIYKPMHKCKMPSFNNVLFKVLIKT